MPAHGMGNRALGRNTLIPVKGGYRPVPLCGLVVLTFAAVLSQEESSLDRIPFDPGR